MRPNTETPANTASHKDLFGVGILKLDQKFEERCEPRPHKLGKETFPKGCVYAKPIQEDNMWRSSGVSRRVFFTRISQSFAVCTTGMVALGRSTTYGQDLAPLYTPKTPIPKDPI